MRNNSPAIFSPIVAIVFFLFSFFLYSLALSDTLAAPSFEMVIYVLANFLMLTVGAAWAFALMQRRRIPLPVDPGSKVNSILSAFLYVSIALYVYEHLLFLLNHGTVPILSLNYEEVRLSFSQSGYVHLLAMMCHTIFVLQYSIFIFNIEEGKSGNKKKMILLASLILLLDFLVGNRGQALFFIYMLVVVTAFYRRIAIKIVLSGLLALYSFGFIKSYREWLFYGDASFVSIENDWGHSVGLFGAAFYHLYMGLAFNFEMLNRYISSLNEFQYGYFTFINPLLSILPGKAYSLVDFQRDELGIYFHGELTATFFSVPYFDFGVFGVIFSFVFGYYAQKFYLVAKNGGRPEDVAIYAYFSLQLFVGVYAYTFDKLYVILDLILLLFLIPLLKGLLRR